ncbi:MAG TPA: AMP-binding protein [Mycobacteriales bacterium]|nr:AMP-binding protein [Mycobacteriales bacterium]
MPADMHDPEVLTAAGRRTVPDLLREGVQRTPERPLLVFDDLDGGVRAFSWSEVSAHAHTVAATLAELGVGPGDRVHVHLPNRPEFLFWWFGTGLRGSAIVPTNVASSVAELEYILQHVGASVSVTDAANLDVVRAARAGAGLADVTLTCDVPSVGAADESAAVVAAPLDDLAIMYTSGTTSRPKGVRVTHANYIFAGESVAASLALAPDDRFLVALPLFHANAQYYSVMSTLVSGGTVILAARFSASRWVDTAIAHRATVGSLFSAPIRMILAQQSQPHWRENALRVVAFAQNITDREAEAWEREIGVPLLQLYGMTETIGPPIVNSLWGRRRHDALGRVVLGYRCRIVDPEGASVRAGKTGELEVGGIPGISLMAGYLKDPVATEATMRDGWLRTGDLVREDADGLISFVTREKDMIKRAGENIAASEIEEVLLAHPSVSDAAVVGVPDAMRDETIVAFVVTRDGPVDEPGLREWCGYRLASFRVPEFFAGIETLPRTSVGKVQKQVLRDLWPAPAGEAQAAGDSAGEPRLR